MTLSLIEENNEVVVDKVGDFIRSGKKNNSNPFYFQKLGYLRFLANIVIDQLLPFGFFKMWGDGDEIWIQFKFEKMTHFCYKCGWLGHEKKKV